MADFNPDFDVTRVDSMQWNRSIQTEVLKDDKATSTEDADEVDPGTVERVRAEIEKQSQPSVDQH